MSPAVAELDETQIIITSINNNVDKGDYVQVTGQLLYANGSELTVEYMSMIMVGLYINGEIDRTYTGVPYEVQVKEGGYFGMQEKLDVAGINTVQVVFRGKEHTNLAASNSSVYNINVIEGGSSGNLHEGMIDFISYAKGFFALSFFAVLGITICTGCYSAYANDPATKSRSTDNMFALVKILGTVTIAYLVVLFLAP